MAGYQRAMSENRVRQTNLEIELNEKINDFESKAGIFSSEAGESLRIELQQTKDKLQEITIERDRLINLND